MDFHFVLPNDSEKKEESDTGQVQFKRLFKRLTPVFLLAAILPMFLFLVSTPADLQFFTRASRESELRIWTEPSRIVADRNREVTLDVYAQFESESLLPGISLVAQSDDLEVSGEITHLKPFNGQLKIGTITANTGSQSGEFNIVIPDESVEITAFDSPLEIITGTTTIYVQ